jgi:hypothetical protein
MQNGAQGPGTSFTVRGPAVPDPALPAPEAFSAITRYQKLIPAVGISVIEVLVAGTMKIPRSQASYAGFRTHGVLANSPRWRR